MESSEILAAKLETNEVAGNEEVLAKLRPVTGEIARQQATWLGRVFLNNFLRLKRLVQDQSTYRMQVDVFTAFVSELLFQDHAVTALEKMIEWKKED